MNSIDDTLIVLREGIEEIFIKLFEDRSNSKRGKEIKNVLFETGKGIYEKLGKEITVNIIYGQYMYYLDHHFYNLFGSYLKNKEKNTDIYQRLTQIKYNNPIEFFFRFGFLCFLLMSKEMQKTIFIDKKYDLFWDELYHFYNQLSIEVENGKRERIQGMLTELEEKKIIYVQNYSNFYTGIKIKQVKGRPSKISIDVLLTFADLLEENRKDKKHTLYDLLEIAAEDKMHPTAIRNWIRDYRPFLHGPKKTIKELTKDDIIIMWKESQKIKDR
jgi:hypothetical protein